MKLKFRADSKDLLIFAIFCLVLLYFVSISVLNLSSFSIYGEFHGLNPFPAFTAEYIMPTLLFFSVALIAITLSVSSYFFDMEKGIGVTTSGKKDKGYSRWAEDKEMKAELKMVNPMADTELSAGIPLMNNGKKVWVDDGEYHNLIIGATGSGKTEMIVQPMVKLLAKKGESMIITDPKGEIYVNNAVELKEKGYNIILLNFRDPQKGNCWNPLNLPYSLYKDGNSDKSIELLDDLAQNILYDESSKNQDPFWEKTSADYFSGLALGLFEDANEREININSIGLMTTIGEEKCGNSTYVKEYFSYKNPAGAAYTNASGTLMAPNETKGSIIAVFKQKIKLFSSRENLSEMLSHSDFDMNDIGRKKTAVFIVVQDEKKTYHSLVTIFLKQCYETLIRVAQESGGKLPFRTNFILDEFANMPPLKDVTTMVTAARSRGIRFSFIIQNFAQLYEVYGKENGETIKGNCSNIVYLISSELASLEELSKLCGEVKSKEKDKTSSTPLVTVSDLQRLPRWTIIVIRARMMPFKTKLTPNFEMERQNLWGKKYDKADFPQRDKEPLLIFNLKEFVDKKKEEKINGILNNIKTDIDDVPGNRSSQPSLPKIDDGFDVDALVKRIDAKIAELEEEEKLEKAKTASASRVKMPTSEIIDNSDSFINSIKEMPTTPIVEKETISKPIFDIKPIERENSYKIEQPKEKITISTSMPEVPVTETKPVEKQSVIVELPKEVKSKPIVTDDQFFDDFFSDE